MSTDHEHALLGAVFLNPSVYDRASEFVSDTDFTSPAMAALWRACGRAVLAGIEPDAITVQDHLNGDGAVEQAGGRSLIHSLASSCPSMRRWKSYAESIHRESSTFQLRTALQEVLDSHATGDDLLREAEDALLAVTDEQTLGTDMQTALKQVWADSQEEKGCGLAYPWYKINEATHGLRPGWLCILAGETGHGKTAGALAITEKVILEGKTVLYCSLEMQPAELATRLAQRADFPSEAIYDREASSHEAAILIGLINNDDWKRFRVERAGTTERIAALIRRFKPDLVVLDHLHLMETAPRESRYEATTRISRELKLLAGRYRVPILALAQLNRLHPSQEQRVPGLSRLRDSGSIEQDADTVLFVWRKRDENDKLTSEGAMRVAKSRMGVTGTVRMTFDGRTQQLGVSEMW
jgi:replicative DNA helicase